MKTKTIISLLALAVTAPAAEKPIPSVPMRERPSHDVLAHRLSRQQDAMKKQAPRPKPAAGQKEKWKPTSLLERSEFLSYRGLATLVPKGALLNVPANLAGRVQMAKDAKIVRWAEFLRRNHAWIDTYEVSRRQAEAEVPLSEEALEAIRKNPSVVVATLSTGPITVLRKPVEAAPQTAATKPGAEPAPTTPAK